MREIMLALSRGDTRLFRANAGKAWQGRSTFRGAVLTLENYRAVELMPAGTPDLIGWHSQIITPADIGKEVAVFVGIECKSATGKYRAAQRKFRSALVDAGGIAGIARNVVEAREILEADVGGKE